MAGVGTWRCLLSHVPVCCRALLAGYGDWSLKAHEITGRFHFDLFGTRSIPQISF